MQMMNVMLAGYEEMLKRKEKKNKDEAKRLMRSHNTLNTYADMMHVSRRSQTIIEKKLKKSDDKLRS